MKEVNYIIRPYKKGEEDYVADAHARVYGEEYNWSDIFVAFAKQVVYDYAALPKSDHAEMWVAEVDGRTENKYIRLTRTFENGSEIITYGANTVRLGVLELAGEAAFATGETDVIEVDEFRFGARLLCARLRCLKHLGGVPALARAGVEEHCEWFTVFHGLSSSFLISMQA